MKTNIKDQLDKLRLEAVKRNKGIAQFNKRLISDYDVLLLANGLDELRDVNIFLLDCGYRNRSLIKQLDDLIKANHSGEGVTDKNEINSVLVSSLTCSKEFKSLELAMQTIRTSKKIADPSKWELSNSFGISMDHQVFP